MRRPPLRQALRRARERWNARVDEFRIHLSRPDALMQLALLGLVTGVLAGAVIVVFRLLVEGAQEALLPGEGAENFESLALTERALFPVLGALLLAAMFRWGARGLTVLGVPHVIERMAYHQGYLGLRGFVLQFFGAAIALISGHSVGREGPHIFLGASAGSLLGQRLGLPNNTIRTLVGCGTAAGIAASFNTPLAGVVFALEVVMMEYTVVSFIPIILAAVSATTVSNAILGDAPAFVVPTLEASSQRELVLVVLLGVFAGTLSAVFNELLQMITAYGRRVAIWWRLLVAGLAMGAFGALLPGVMGIGYDSVAAALAGNLGVGLMLALLLAKLVATSVTVGLGVPGGMIGPALFIGAMLGGLVAQLALLLPLGISGHPHVYALLGMGAMMSASLQAPLAALTAMLELTDNPDIILPGMLAVVVSGVTASELFRKKSLFLSILHARGLDYNTSPVLQALRRVGVASVMERNFARVDRLTSHGRARELIARRPVYLLIDEGDKPAWLMPAVDLARALEAGAGRADAANLADAADEEPLDMVEIPGSRLHVAPIQLQANLDQASTLFGNRAIESLYVERVTAPGVSRIYGVLTPDMVERAYR